MEKNINVDDYVIHITKKYPILITNIIVDNNIRILESENKNNRFLESECSLWIPKDDEPCWFYQNIGNTPILGDYLGRMENNSYLASISNGKGKFRLKIFKYCKPFTGKILK